MIRFPHKCVSHIRLPHINKSAAFHPTYVWLILLSFTDIGSSIISFSVVLFVSLEIIHFIIHACIRFFVLIYNMLEFCSTSVQRSLIIRKVNVYLLLVVSYIMLWSVDLPRCRRWKITDLWRAAAGLGAGFLVIVACAVRFYIFAFVYYMVCVWI